MKITDFEFLRVKLAEEGEDEFWKSVDEKGGVIKIAEEEKLPKHKLYNWKSNKSFLPIKLIEKYLDNWKDYLKAYKGEGRSKQIQKPELPLPNNNELLTRREASVNINEKGVPVYQTQDKGLLERFHQLLEEFGEVPVKIYKRDIYELRYPIFLDKIMRSMDFSQDITALVDESGEIDQDGAIILNGDKIEFQNVGRLYHREKRMKLALARGDRKEITRLMSEEKEKVRKALNQA